MKVGIIQSSYLPWRGYFDFIGSVDLFIILDDAQFTTRDWRSRNRIKTRQGMQWITVPVRHGGRAQRICDTAIDHSRNWQRDHYLSIRHSYAKAPYTADVLAMLEPAFDARPVTITDLNVTLLQSICAYLGIHTPMRFSADFAVDGVKTERLIALLRSVGATTYLSGPSAKSYLEPWRFERAGIRLEWKTYAYPEYPQLWGPFEGGVSIVDLIANCGPGAAALIRSAEPNERVAAPGEQVAA